MTFFTDNVVLLPPLVEPSVESRLKFSPSRDIENLKRYLLYFPRLAIVPYYNEFLGLNLVTPEHQLLRAQRQITSVGGRQVEVACLDSDFFEDDINDVLYSVNCANHGVKFSSALPIAMESELSSANGLLCRIVEALPAPRPDVSTAEIIQFRESKIIELENFGKRITRLIAMFVDENKPTANGVNSALGELREQMEAFEASVAGSGLFNGKLSLDIGSLINSGLIPALSEFIASSVGIPAGIGATAGGVFQYSFVRTKTESPGNVFPRDFQYILHGHQQHITGGEYDQVADDYVHLHTDVQGNVIGFAMPPQDTPIMLPKNTFYNNIIL